MDNAIGTYELKIRDELILARKRYKRAQKIVRLLPPVQMSPLVRVVHYLVSLAISFEWNIRYLNENRPTNFHSKHELWLLYVIPRPILWETYPLTVKLWKLASSLLHKDDDDDHSFSNNPPLRLTYN